MISGGESMEKHRAIPEGYMTVGEVAKKTGTTVRTLQYYDKEGILTSSMESEGGRRLYTNKDIVKLYQIQSMKYLGFSLEDIKNRLPQINTPKEVSTLLTEQAKGVRETIKSLEDVLESIEKLNEEVVQMDTVDWAKYADIVGMLLAKNSGYWVVKHMDYSLTEHVLDNLDDTLATQLNEKYIQILKSSVETQKAGYAPDSAEAIEMAKEWWDYIAKITKGDFSMLSKLMSMGNKLDQDEWLEKFSFDKDYLVKALGAYFVKIGYNPYIQEGKND